jgi:uncharacterized protein (TIGR02391 family)
MEFNIQKFPDEVLEHIAKLIGEIKTGTEITEFFRVAGYPEIQHDGGTKWKFVYRVLLNFNRQKDGQYEIAKIIQKFADPLQFIGRENERLEVIDHINMALLHFGIQLNKEGKLVASTEKRTYSEPDIINLLKHYNLHPKILEVSKSLFESGHYAQSIFEAFKVVEKMVKEKSGIKGQYGKRLMSLVFNENHPILKIADVETDTGKDEQEGFKFLFMGASVGIRNPKAHDVITQKDPVKTLEYLSFASLLARRIDEAKKVTP